MSKWMLRDSATGYYLAADLFDESGAVLSRYPSRAARFSTIAAARSTVLQICNVAKKNGKKATLKIEIAR